MNKKKLIIIIVASVLAVALLATGGYFLIKNGFSAGTSGKAVISVESVSAKVGDTVKIPVKISGNKGFMGFLLEFQYDNEALKYDGYDKGDVITDYEFSDNDGTLSFVCIENDDVKKNGTLVYLKFKVLDTKKNSAEIKVNVNKESFANSNEEYVVFNGKNGTVTIK